jgi:branched-chain amino acid transport system ATP-binding protein
MPVLEIADLAVRYGGIVAVRNVSLSVEPGEIFVLLGANGAGKSSTLRGITGLVKRSGSIRWDGQDISKWRSNRIARSGMVLVPEGRRIFSPLTVEENLLLGAYTQKSKEWQRTCIERVFTMFPILADRRKGRAGLLSGGEQQMLAFGRALMANPRMILMDEPSMGLAPAVVDFVMGSVAAIAESGIAVLMVEQNAAVALDVAHRAAVLERGEVSLRGSAAELREDPGVLRAFLGDKADRVDLTKQAIDEPA